MLFNNWPQKFFWICLFTQAKKKKKKKKKKRKKKKKKIAEINK